MKKQYKKYYKFFKKYFYTILLVVAIILVIPMLRYTFPEDTVLHGAAPEISGITVNLPIPNGSYTVFDSQNKLILHDRGISNTFNLPVGVYRIEFSSLYGYSTPKKQVFTVRPSENVTLKGDYFPIYNSPLLGVEVFPQNAPYIIFDDQNKVAAEGTGSQFFHLPPGNYKIIFQKLQDYKSPGQQQFFVADRVVTTINAAYGKIK